MNLCLLQSRSLLIAKNLGLNRFRSTRWLRGSEGPEAPRYEILLKSKAKLRNLENVLKPNH